MGDAASASCYCIAVCYNLVLLSPLLRLWEVVLCGLSPSQVKFIRNDFLNVLVGTGCLLHVILLQRTSSGAYWICSASSPNRDSIFF